MWNEKILNCIWPVCTYTQTHTNKFLIKPECTLWYPTTKKEMLTQYSFHLNEFFPFLLEQSTCFLPYYQWIILLVWTIAKHISQASSAESILHAHQLEFFNLHIWKTIHHHLSQSSQPSALHPPPQLLLLLSGLPLLYLHLLPLLTWFHHHLHPNGAATDVRMHPHLLW